ncbi:MAG: ATP-binding protein [Oscillospiraceae bacterium]|nr:ATP-binding protein [Oscillospiraceae bacterium]
MQEKFIGRENELAELNDMYEQKKFQLFVLYGRRRVGKTTLLNEFCRNKAHIFYSAEQSNNKLNLEKFSEQVFEFYGERNLEPFSSWTNAISYINDRQKDKRLVLIIDEFPYLVKKNRALLSELQHLIDHQLKSGNLFLILCGSYMGFMEKEVLASESPLFGRRTGQLQLKPFTYLTAARFMNGYSDTEKIELYGAFGGTPMYLQQIDPDETFEENIKRAYLKVTSYLYEEAVLLLRQEVQEPGVYSAIIEAVAGGHTRANEISTKIGEESAKCLKYIKTLCELGILYREAPFGENESSRKTLYGISDFMFRFWYRYVFSGRTLIETGARQALWKKHIEPDYSVYMGLVFEKVCMDYLYMKNAECELPFLFTSSGRWWGTNPATRSQEEIDIIASDGKDYIFGECKWRNEKLDISVLETLKERADMFSKKRNETYYYLFSKSSFTDAVLNAAEADDHIFVVDLHEIMHFKDTEAEK